jgi:DNA replication terminus site-binding protein Ter
MPTPDVSNSALRAELGIRLKGLQEALATFTDHLQTEARDAWIWRKPSGKVDALTPPAPEISREHTLELIAQALNDIKYTDGQDPHESRIAPGVLVLSEEGLELASEVNRQKRGLASVLRTMQGRTEEGVINQRTGERGERPLREVALEAFFFRRLHHWQATRELVVLRESNRSIGTPDYIGFSWATCRDVRRTERETMIQQLEEGRATAEDVARYDRDLSLLRKLAPKEPLAIVRPGHTTPKANIAWPAGPDGKPIRQIKPAVLPLVMLGKSLPARFRKLPAAPTPRHFRLARVDTEIEAKALLETIPVYRYLPHFRGAKRAEMAASA